MSQTYDFFIAGRTRNKEKILQICSIFDEFNISYYCFLKNEKSHTDAGLNLHENPEELSSSAHIEAGVAYGLGKKCYAIGEYEATDSLYLIFDRIFADEEELREFLRHKN